MSTKAEESKGQYSYSFIFLNNTLLIPYICLSPHDALRNPIIETTPPTTQKTP